jgi:hypothetical protein
MKTISTLFASLLLSTSMFATDVRSSASLTVKSATKSDIVVLVDDKRYDLGTNAVMISDLDACEHQVTVYQEKANSFINRFGETYDVVFNSSIEFKSRANVRINIDECGSVTMTETRSARPMIGDTWNGENYFKDNAPITTGIYSNAISNSEFSRVLWAIGKETSEANRMKSAEQIINTNYLTVDQVKQLMQLFCTEDNKLEIAKLAYDKTVDRGNYFALNSVFKFDNSRDELARCISR